MTEAGDFVTEICTSLEKAGARGVPVYRQRLMDNRVGDNFEDFVLEGRAALMFRLAGFGVTFQESPDLALELNGERLYAEVKHFRLKQQDLIDDARMREPGDVLVPYGDTYSLEGKCACQQVYKVAKKKVTQYRQDAPNILIVESDSPNCIEDTEARTAVSMIDDDILADSGSKLHALNGILVVTLGWFNLSQLRNAFFFPTRDPKVPLSQEVHDRLAGITSV